MSLFAPKTSGILGIDVGASAVKMVELVREGGRVQLRTYGFTERSPSEAAAFDPREHTEEMGAVIKELCRRSGARATTAIASLPTFSVFSSIITLPELPKKELPEAIRWEAKKLIPLPIDEMILNWEILPEGLPLVHAAAGKPLPSDKTTGDLTPNAPLVVQEKMKKSITVLVTAAQKKLVEQYVAIFKAAGMTLQSLETEAFALVRSLVGNDKSSVMIADIGARNTDLSIIDHGVPVLNRSTNFGGASFTATIMKAANVSLSVAEQVKRDIGRVASAGEVKAFQTLLTPLVNEIQYTVGLYQTRSGRRIEKIILTGGSGFLFNLTALLSTTLQMTVTIGDPWARVATPVDLSPVLQEIGPRMSVAVGLAMRNV